MKLLFWRHGFAGTGQTGMPRRIPPTLPVTTVGKSSPAGAGAGGGVGLDAMRAEDTAWRSRWEDAVCMRHQWLTIHLMQIEPVASDADQSDLSDEDLLTTSYSKRMRGEIEQMLRDGATSTTPDGMKDLPHPPDEKRNPRHL